MIQRIQTLYMLASVVAILMMFFFPLASFMIPEATFTLNAFGLVSITPAVPVDEMRWALSVLLLLMLLLPLVSIFLYKKLRIQMRLLIFTAVLDLLFYGYFYLIEINTCEALVRYMGVSTKFESEISLIPAIMPIISVFGCVMAIKGVLHDIVLLESTTRLRSKRKK